MPDRMCPVVTNLVGEMQKNKNIYLMGLNNCIIAGPSMCTCIFAHSSNTSRLHVWMHVLSCRDSDLTSRVPSSPQLEYPHVTCMFKSAHSARQGASKSTIPINSEGSNLPGCPNMTTFLPRPWSTSEQTCGQAHQNLQCHSIPSC